MQNRLYILKFIYREVKDQPISTKFLYKEGVEILGLERRNLSNQIRLLNKEGLLVEVITTDYDKRVHEYRITEEGLKFIYAKKETFRPKSKKGFCYNCNKKKILWRFRGQYYCSKCMILSESSDLRLEDYIYNGPGFIW